MRIATSLAFLVAATVLPALPANAQHAGDPAASYGISTSHLQGAARVAYRARGNRRGYTHARRYQRGYAYRHAKRHVHRHAHRHTHRHAGAGASRACLTADTRRVLSGLEARFGSVRVISTCRPGAVIAGSGRPSQHRYGKAVDFVPNGNRAAIMSWLRSNANGAVITYASGHIHFDTGGYRNFAVSAKARRAYARAR
jgi:uncharacterized protein YcbK (DUF882 family)